MPVQMLKTPFFQMIRHEPRRRELTVARVERLSPAMIRVVLAGESLADFVSEAPDDHIKLFLPDGAGGEVMRDFTPRRFDRHRRELALDFVDHVGGPAASWARAARPGDRLAIGGPRGSRKLLGDIDAWLLIGDETALPAIGRRVEELADGVPVTTLAAVPGPADAQAFVTAAQHTAAWVHRPLTDAADPAPLLDALAKLQWAPRTFVWIAAEAGVARALRRHVLETRGHDPAWFKGSSYWAAGVAGAADRDLA